MVRLKYRWLVTQILFEHASTTYEMAAQDIQNSIREKIQILFGDVGMGNFGNSTMVRFYDKYTNIIILRTPRESLEDVWFALSCLTAITKNTTTMRVLHVSGSNRTCIDYMNNFFTTIISPFILSSEIDQRKDSFLKQLSNIDS
eukprot:gene3520-7006_t